MKSVTINQAERSKMTSRIRRDYNKLKASRAADYVSDFYTKISTRIAKRLIADIPKEVIKYVPHREATTDGIFSFRTISLIDSVGDPVVIKEYDVTYNNMESHTRLGNVPAKSLKEFDSPHDNSNTYLIPFWIQDFPSDSSGDVVLTQDELDDIAENNAHLDKEIGALEAMQKELIRKVEGCRSTKQFYSEVPFLENILPDSVKDKLKEANSKSEEESTFEEQLRAAADMLAAAALIEDK